MKGYIKIASSLYSRSALYTKSDVIVYLIRPLYKFEFDNNDAIKSNNWRYHLMLTMFKLVKRMISSQIIASLFLNKFELVQEITPAKPNIASLFSELTSRSMTS